MGYSGGLCLTSFSLIILMQKAINSGHFVLPAMPKVHALRSDQFLADTSYVLFVNFCVFFLLTFGNIKLV